MNKSDHNTSYEVTRRRRPATVKEEQHEVQFTQVHTITDLSEPTTEPSTNIDYSVEHLKNAASKVDNDPGDMFEFITHYMFVQLQAQDYGADAHKQMNGKDGVRKFGRKAVEALAKEMSQFLDLDVFEGSMADTLTVEQKKQALHALALVKLKRNLILKGRIVADGRKQREIYTKEEITSSTCHNDTLMLTFLIEAIERRAVATGDVPGAYLHALMRDFVILKITGEFLESLCQANPEYKKYITYENGKKVIYARLKKALYGCVMSALLWYELFVTTLKDMGFKVNDYDTCVANKDINGKQYTITWYVDDLKVSHVEQSVVDDIV